MTKTFMNFTYFTGKFLLWNTQAMLHFAWCFTLSRKFNSIMNYALTNHEARISTLQVIGVSNTLSITSYRGWGALESPPQKTWRYVVSYSKLENWYSLILMHDAVAVPYKLLPPHPVWTPESTLSPSLPYVAITETFPWGSTILMAGLLAREVE